MDQYFESRLEGFGMEKSKDKTTKFRYTLNHRAVVLNDTKSIRDGLSDAALSGRPPTRWIGLRQIGGISKGIVFNSGPAAEEQRRFVSGHLSGLFPKEAASELVARMRKSIGKRERMSLKHTFNESVLSSLWSVLMGERPKKNESSELEHMLKSLSEMMMEEGGTTGGSTFLPLWASEWFSSSGKSYRYSPRFEKLPQVYSFLQRFIAQHEEAATGLLDGYIEKVRATTANPSSIFHKAANFEMARPLLELLVVGTETISTALTWACLLLSKYPEVQERLHGEIHSLDEEKRRRMPWPYAQAVLHEVLRFASITPFALPHWATEDTELRGYSIPKGTMIIPNVYAAHHEPSLWGDPESFRPERWISEEDGRFKENENFLAFGTGGRRACVGERLGTLLLCLTLTEIVQHFEVRVEGAIDLEPVMGGLLLGIRPHSFVFKERK